MSRAAAAEAEMAQVSIAKALAGARLAPSSGLDAARRPGSVPGSSPSSTLRVGPPQKLGRCVTRLCRRLVSAPSTLRVSASSAATAEKASTMPEIVLQPIKEISGTVKLPGSKSLSNRILLLAALSEVNHLTRLVACRLRIISDENFCLDIV